MTTEEKRVKLAEYRKESPRCSFIKKDGTRCKGIASKATNRCPVHSGFVPQLNREIDISKDLISVRKFLARTAMSLKRGKIKANDANALANLCDKLIKVYQLMEGEAKLDEIKAMLEEVKSGSAEYADAQYLGTLESEYDTDK